MNGDSTVLELPHFLPALGLALAAVLVLSLVVLLVRHRGSKQGGTRKASTFLNGERAAAEEDDRPKALILFGTQTGTAERFSKQLKSELAARYGEGNKYEVLDLEDFKGENLAQQKLVFFMVATYGDGEPTDNAADFYSWAVKAASEAEKGIGNKQLLEGLSYGVFGLGNKQYEHFCAVGKRIHKALASLGGHAIVRRGDGDDDEDIEADFESWRTELYAALDKADVLAKNAVRSPGGFKSGEPGVTQIVAAAASVPAYQVEILTGTDAEGAEDTSRDAPVLGSGTNKDSPFLARIGALRELHGPASERSCVHVELDVSGSGITYETGDHVGILPENGPETVARAAKALGYPLDTVIRLSAPADSGLAQPFTGGPMTLRAALARYCDLWSPVSKPALQALCAFAAGPDQARLQRLLSPDGAAEYKAWHQQSRALLEVLEEFPSIKPPLGAFFGSIAPRLQTRFYSISSSPLMHPKSIHITCAIVHDTTVTGRLHEGIASFFLKSRAAGQRVPVFVRHSSFRLPTDPCVPIVMVGPGTGLAPFRGFLQERAMLLKQGAKLGPAYLFFGCRKADHDYIYADELAEYVKSGALTKLWVAFSRAGAEKEYVQHQLQREGTLVAPVLSKAGPGHFYVCGDAKNMAKDVARTAVAIVKESEGVSTAEAEAVLKKVSDAGRIQKDVW